MTFIMKCRYERLFPSLVKGHTKVHLTSLHKKDFNQLHTFSQFTLPILFNLKYSFCLKHQSNPLYSSSITFVQSNITLNKQDVFEENKEKIATKKKPDFTSPLIKLLDFNNKLSIVTLEGATKIAKHHNCKLTKLDDGNVHSKPLYKLVRNIFEEEKKLSKKSFKPGIKGEKRLLINDIIAPFDLEIKLKKIESFLSKDYEVLIIVQSSSKADEDSSKLTKTCNAIEKLVEGKGKIYERQTFGRGIRLKMMPILKAQEKP